MKQLAAVITLLPMLAFSQIAVNINSGNPVSPFPQFQPYVNPTDTLYNLASKNPSGVSHAEMEKSIREAYQIMMNRAGKPGGGVGGVDYIKFVSQPQCSEGDGYGLLAAAGLADKATFDGMWLYIHDVNMNKVKRYKDCVDANPGYAYSRLPGWTGAGANSAADGDFDIALALLYAYRQWGEFMGIDDGCGNPISYKQAAIDFISALTDTFTYATSGPGLLSGDIGLDGYVKSGDSWNEITDWASDTARSGLPRPPEYRGPATQYFDYFAPAYFTQFADFLASEDSARYAWNIRQFRRAAASSDWLMGQLFAANPRYIPQAGRVEVSGSAATFQSTGITGEDFRLAWRTILNRVWNGNPSSTWDPVAHLVQAAVPNSFEQDIGRRYAKFLWDARQAPWNNECVKPVSASVGTYWGPSVLTMGYTVEGTADAPFFFSWTHGTGSPSAVVAQDFQLMAELYRQCEIDYDVETPGKTYLEDVPKYFHDWFRLLGMLVLSGNYLPPSQVRPSANLKIYCNVDKTCMSKGENAVFTLAYRNYGTQDAHDVVITAAVPPGLSVASSTAGGAYVPATRTITWNINRVAGFTSSVGGAPTAGNVEFMVSADDGASGRLTCPAAIRCSDGTGWTANDYPNTVSADFRQNYIDIVNQPAGDTQSVKSLPVLHGGRPGVRFSFSSGGENASSAMQTIRIRMFNDAQEPYIDIGNYRISYFLYDSVHTCFSGGEGCPAGWGLTLAVTEGIEKKYVQILHELLAPGLTERGKWNQRIIIQFSDPSVPGGGENLTTITRVLETYRGMSQLIHRGGVDPLRLIFTINSPTWQPVLWGDDWSWNGKAAGNDNSPGFPISPDFTDPAPGNPGVPVNSLNPKHCTVTDTTVDNILVEEWDGYVWRKVFGNAPQIAVGAVSPVRMANVNQMLIVAAAPGTLRYTLAGSGFVRLQVLDMKGRIMTVPVDGFRDAGTHTVKWAPPHAGAGVYVARLAAGGGERMLRLVRVK